MDEHAQAAVGTRIVGRTLAGVWRQKQAIAAGAVIVTALAGYWVLGPSRAAPSDPTMGLASGDCADTAMAALANRTPDSLEQAYQCMDLSYRQRVSAQQFTTQVKAAGNAPVTKVERVGTHAEPNGSELVYYALDSGNQSVGYIIYLGANGKILKIE